jgi:hypothetical protein
MRQPPSQGGSSPCQRLVHFLVAGVTHILVTSLTRVTAMPIVKLRESVGFAGRCRNGVGQMYVKRGYVCPAKTLECLVHTLVACPHGAP